MLITITDAEGLAFIEYVKDHSLSLRPTPKLAHGLVNDEPWAQLITDSWNPARNLPVAIMSGAEFDALNTITFTGE